jgi:lysosomal acid lipase/cholesteryl ester hydrolase
MNDWVDNYQWDPYTVTTTDGYKLTMFKITKRGVSYDHPHRESVLYQHGYGQDATTTLVQSNAAFPGEKTNIFKTIDDGFDVWMGNFRGTKYSQGHTNPYPDYNETFDYWNFTFAQLGVYDMPAFVDKIY